MRNVIGLFSERHLLNFTELHRPILNICFGYVLIRCIKIYETVQQCIKEMYTANMCMIKYGNVYCSVVTEQ